MHYSLEFTMCLHKAQQSKLLGAPVVNITEGHTEAEAGWMAQGLLNWRVKSIGILSRWLRWLGCSGQKWESSTFFSEEKSILDGTFTHSKLGNCTKGGFAVRLINLALISTSGTRLNICLLYTAVNTAMHIHLDGLVRHLISLLVG